MNEDTPVTALAGIALVALGVAAVAAAGRRRPPRAAAPRASQRRSVPAARRLNRAAGTLAACVLSDSAVEHYRGAFHNKTMLAPLASATLSLAASVHGHADARARAHRMRDGVYALAIATGLVGTAFHVYNIGKRPGRFSWQNFFYAAPVGAPAALSLSGILGVAAERVRDTAPGRAPKLLGLPAGRALAALTSLGLIGSVGEAGLLHLRGAYHNPVMWAPVSLPPVSAALLAATAVSPSPRLRRLTKGWLRLTAIVGGIGSAFHAYGVSRGMGGWANWRQNLLNGPPIPAPPSFTGLAMAGLAALELQEQAGHER